MVMVTPEIEVGFEAELVPVLVAAVLVTVVLVFAMSSTLLGRTTRAAGSAVPLCVTSDVPARPGQLPPADGTCDG